MKRKRVIELKEKLKHASEDGGYISREDASELLDLMNRVFPRSVVIRDTTPMIGLNPFRPYVRSKPMEDEIVSDGDHFRTEDPNHRDRLFTLLNQEMENNG